MEMQKNLEKLGCSFYKVEGTDVQVCITSGKDWKDIAVFKFEEGKVVMLPVESNEFRGERLNRATWSQLVWLKSLESIRLCLLMRKMQIFVEKYVTDYFLIIKMSL